MSEMIEELEEIPNPTLSQEEQGRLFYQFAVAQANLGFYHRLVVRPAKYVWTRLANVLEDVGGLGTHIFYNAEAVYAHIKHEIGSFLTEILHLPETTIYMWRSGRFSLPFRNMQSYFHYFFSAKGGLRTQWNHTIRNMQTALDYPWSWQFKLYVGSVTALSLFTIYHYKLQPWPKHEVTNEVKVAHRTVVITGASSGIGYRLAYEFVKRGAFVVITSPDIVKARTARLQISHKLLHYIEKGKRRFLENANARYYHQIQLPHHFDTDHLLQNIVEVELNLACSASIYSFARKIQGMCPDGIDILINNAAINAPPNEMVVSDEGKEAHFAVNYFGHFVLTNLLLSSLAKRKGARIINVTCKNAVEKGFIKMDEFINPYLEEEGLPFLPAYDGYANSKLAMYLFNRQLSKELQLSNINNVTTYSVCPGVSRTFLDRRIVFSSWFSKLYYNLTSKFYKRPFQAVQPILYCALSPNCSLESGFFYENNRRSCLRTRHRNPDDVAETLWKSSLKLMGITHTPLLKLTEQMHLRSHENIFQLAKDLFLHRRDVTTHLLLTDEKQAFITRHKMRKDDNGDARKDFTYFWNGFFLSGGEKSSLLERWVLYNTHPGFRALQQEYDIWFECTGSAHFHPESNGKMASLQYMDSMSAPLTQDDIVELEKVYESDSEPDDDIEDRERYYLDYVPVEEFIE